MNYERKRCIKARKGLRPRKVEAEKKERKKRENDFTVIDMAYLRILEPYKTFENHKYQAVSEVACDSII